MRCDLSGKVSLVTGAARGIGQAIADRLADNGSLVIYTDVDRSRGRRGGASPRCPVAAARCDQTGRDRHRDRAHRRRSRPARHPGEQRGDQHDGAPRDHRRVPRDEWDRILAVDLTGLYEVSRAAARVMRARGSGRIINIASIVGLVPLRLQCAFVAAKAGVVNLTRAMALELGPHGILVNGVAPGSTLTEGTRQLFYGKDGSFHAQVQRMLDHVPLGRPATPDEIAVAVLFLADPENSYMNGHMLTVDGGWTAGYTRDF